MSGHTKGFGILAAASDMFAVCKMLEERLPLIADPDAVGEEECAEIPITWREWSMIRAAIARAEGRQP